jgi:hypothetical protein
MTKTDAGGPWYWYECILDHTSSSTNEPYWGAQWTTYWSSVGGEQQPNQVSARDIYWLNGVQIINSSGEFFTKNLIVDVVGGATIGVKGDGGAAYDLCDDNAGADAKRWRLLAAGGNFAIDLINDAYSSAVNAIQVARSGMTTTQIDLNGAGVKVAGGFGCNAANPQAAYASGGALTVYATGSYGYSTAAKAQGLYNLVVAIRAALVANGIMS